MLKLTIYWLTNKKQNIKTILKKSFLEIIKKLGNQTGAQGIFIIENTTN
jgi:hypothetical protein